MRAEGLDCILPMEKFQVMGFIDVFFALPRLMRYFFHLRRTLLEKQPDLVLFIDYPGFSLALAKSLSKRSFKGKICHYICPSVWAWGKKRIAKMEKILDHLFVIYPFEAALFDREKLQVDYVGNPLVQNIEPLKTSDQRIVALFPGSRQKEILRNFPKQLRVAQKLLKKYPDLHFSVSVAHPSYIPLLKKIMGDVKMDLLENSAIMKSCTIAIAKSGTNNLELALHQVPTIVTYGIGAVDLFVVKNVLKLNLPYYCIVNIIGGKLVFPELMGPHFTEASLFEHADKLLSSKEALNECREKCGEIGKILERKIPEVEIIRILKNENRPIQSLH